MADLIEAKSMQSPRMIDSDSECSSDRIYAPHRPQILLEGDDQVNESSILVHLDDQPSKIGIASDHLTQYGQAAPI